MWAGSRLIAGALVINRAGTVLLSTEGLLHLFLAGEIVLEMSTRGARGAGVLGVFRSDLGSFISLHS